MNTILNDQKKSLGAHTHHDEIFIVETCNTFGPTLIRRESGRTELNHASMSRILARRLQIAYDADARVFYNQETSAPVTKVSVIQLATAILQQIAAQHANTFPLRDLRPARIKQLVETMKVTAALVRPDRHSGLIRFIAEQLCPVPTRAITVVEIYDAYRAFAYQAKVSIYPESAFRREIHPALLAAFNKTPSNSILRLAKDGSRQTYRRGYKGLALKEEIKGT